MLVNNRSLYDDSVLAVLHPNQINVMIDTSLLSAQSACQVTLLFADIQGV